MTDTTTDDLREALLALSEALDPERQGEQWPDPVAWDGRPLVEQARDLLALADAQDSWTLRGSRLVAVQDATADLRAALARAEGRAS